MKTIAVIGATGMLGKPVTSVSTPGKRDSTRVFPTRTNLFFDFF
jgi:hypothetical protein